MKPHKATSKNENRSEHQTPATIQVPVIRHLIFILTFILLVLSSSPVLRISEETTDLRTLEPTVDSSPRPRRLKPGELVLAADRDDIPPIHANHELFVGAAEGDLEWDDGELVIGLGIDQDARAYPVRLLSLHEIVNDTVGSRPVVVTWCPLCFSAVAFSRLVDRELTFGASGYLYLNNLVMYDLQTETLWSQLLGQGLRGAYRGQYLETIPVELTAWQSWKEAHPETRILSAQKLRADADGIIDPYNGYYSSGTAGLTPWAEDVRLAAKELVIGVSIGEHARAYPQSTVRQLSVITDQLGAVALVLSYDSDLQTVFVYRSKDGCLGEGRQTTSSISSSKKV